MSFCITHDLTTKNFIIEVEEALKESNSLEAFNFKIVGSFFEHCVNCPFPFDGREPEMERRPG